MVRCLISYHSLESLSLVSAFRLDPRNDILLLLFSTVRIAEIIPFYAFQFCKGTGQCLSWFRDVCFWQGIYQNAKRCPQQALFNQIYVFRGQSFIWDVRNIIDFVVLADISFLIFEDHRHNASSAALDSRSSLGFKINQYLWQAKNFSFICHIVTPSLN